MNLGSQQEIKKTWCVRNTKQSSLLQSSDQFNFLITLSHIHSIIHTHDLFIPRCTYETARYWNFGVLALEKVQDIYLWKHMNKTTELFICCGFSGT